MEMPSLCARIRPPIPAVDDSTQKPRMSRDSRHDTAKVQCRDEGGENIGAAEGGRDRAIWLPSECMRRDPTEQAKCPDVAFVQSSGTPMSVRRAGRGLDQRGLERRCY